MENIFDLDEFSNQKDNSESSEDSKNNSPPKLKDILSSSNCTSSEKEELTPEKAQEKQGQIHNYSAEEKKEISNNPINIPSFAYKNSFSSDKAKSSKHKIISYDIDESEEKSLNEYAIEDQISVSKFDDIKEFAMNFKFKLDDFQKRSIIRLEQNKNILVCAHTSSGKTLVAEYGIALGKKKGKRVIYTSPIKALSNQKYCEFKKKFKDVGIITGDVNINPNAQCLIITTEILHKFLYNQSETLNNVGTVIFDEVHYINDNERGHIWEEILIILPNYISIIMLSATIPNYYEFACWVGKIKNTIVYVEITKNRVVPLEYFIYIDQDSIFKVKDKEDNINNVEIENAFNYLKRIKAPKNNMNKKLNLNLKNNNFNNEEKNMDDIKDKENDETKDGKDNNKEIENDKTNNDKDIKDDDDNNNNKNIIKEEHMNSFSSNDCNENDEVELEENEGNEIIDEEINCEKEKHHIKKSKRKILEVINYLIKSNLFPATLFVFNLKKIKNYSSMLLKENTLSEMSKEEKAKINSFFDKAISSIPNDEQNIPQIKYVKKILQYGIGVHHSGLLPILKEIIEILYFHGLIKILFATTSFSIGLNMPTRSVVFISLQKFHEGKSEMLNSSEFLQMCGRAGRRGIDSCGKVFIIYSQPQGKSQITKLKNILQGEGIDLESKFRLSYRIILSFFHRNLKNIDDFFKESFHESHSLEIKPERLKEIKKLKCEIKKKSKIKCLKNGNKNNEYEENSCEEMFIDIEQSPMAILIKNINKYDLINKNIYTNEKVIEYLKNNPGTIMKIKISNNTTINKFHKSDFVFLINIFPIKNVKKLWCMTITSREIIKNNNDSNSNNNKKEDESKEKENESQIYLTEQKNRGKYKEYKYKYLLINFNDIIEIYDKPKVDLKSFYKKGKINDYFEIKNKEYYYFKYDDKCLYLALKYFYRAIINNFPKKANDVQVKPHKSKKNNQTTELKSVKVLDCQKIIGTENDNNKIFHKKKKIKERIKKTVCESCPYYPNHLCTYKEISNMKERINEINNEILQGEKNETYRKFNKRLELLKNLGYIQYNNNENDENDENNNDINDLENNTYDNYTLTIKGKASIEIISNDNILITELLLSNIFERDDNILPSEIIVPFLSSFVNNTKIRDLNTQIKLEDNNNEDLQYLMTNFKKKYNEIVKMEEAYELKESVYNRSFSFKYFYSFYSWMIGNNFGEVCTQREIMEGKLYNIIMRTFYFVEEIVIFYKKIGNGKMASTFENIKNKLLKGIMSVESLYLKEDIDIDNI